MPEHSAFPNFKPFAIRTPTGQSRHHLTNALLGRVAIAYPAKPAMPHISQNQMPQRSTNGKSFELFVHSCVAGWSSFLEHLLHEICVLFAIQRKTYCRSLSRTQQHRIGQLDRISSFVYRDRLKFRFHALRQESRHKKPQHVAVRGKLNHARFVFEIPISCVSCAVRSRIESRSFAIVTFPFSIVTRPDRSSTMREIAGASIVLM